LTTLFGTDAVPAVSVIAAPADPKKHGWLPLLTVLFLLSYGLMTMLIVEQGRTIDSQRALIRELFRDSTELSAVKQKAAQDSAQASSAKTQAPVTQNPSTQYPSTQAPTSQAPSSQAGPQQQRTQSQSAKQKPDFKMPSKPAADLVDDVRTLITI
jgi:cytoskeletal protein RodZ